MDKKLIITINREYGSGGKLIGKALSKRLGIPYYDEDILKISSEKSAIGEQFFRMNDEKPGGNIIKKIIGGLKNSLDTPVNSANLVSPDNLFKFQSEVIKKLAQEESCIFIGRCSNFVLEASGMEDFVSLFVYSDLPSKIQRVMEVDGLDTKDALERVMKINKNRSSYYKYYTGEDWTDMTNYDLTINTSKLDIDKATDLIINYLELIGYTF